MNLFPDNIMAESFGIEDYMKNKEAVNPSKEVVKKDIGGGTIEDLRSSAKECMGCRLGATRKNLVFGEGSPTAKLMFVGEGPGADEDETGRPFVGRSGQLLTKMIQAMGFQREEVYIANIVKCRPPENRNPFDDEAAACIHFLKEQINIINPEYLVCLGSVAINHLLGTKEPISRIRGKWQSFEGYKVMPTFHPSYLLRSPNKKAEAWQDLKTVMSAMASK